MATITTEDLPRKLWEHPDPKSTQMWKLMQEVNRKSGRNLQVSLNRTWFFPSTLLLSNFPSSSCQSGVEGWREEAKGDLEVFSPLSS